MGESAASPKPAPGAAMGSGGFNPAEVERPDPALMTYYLLVAALTLVGFPFVAIAGWLKYRTLIYKFDDKGVSMAYGMFFRKEVYLTYRRIQDIHVTRNLFHRWLGLADVAVQTASGAAGAEMTIEGIRNPEQLRDYLYARMRGVEDDSDAADDGADGGPAADHRAAATVESAGAPAANAMSAEAGPANGRGLEDEALSLLLEIRDTLHEIRVTRTGPGRDEAGQSGGGT